MFRHRPFTAASLLRPVVLASAAAGITLLSGASLNASTLLSNHFTGNSGGVPAGWTDLGDTHPLSVVVESGTTVALTDVRANNGPQLIVSPTFGGIDDFQLTVDVSYATGERFVEPGIIAGFGGSGGYTLLTKFNTASKKFEAYVLGSSSAGGLLPTAASIPSYAGGAFSYSIAGDLDSFRITSPLDGYDSGDILYSSIGVADFDSIHDLGGTAAMVIGTESGGNTEAGLATVAFDRVVLTGSLTPTLDVPSVPEPSTYAAGLAVIGAVGTTWWRRNARR